MIDPVQLTADLARIPSSDPPGGELPRAVSVGPCNPKLRKGGYLPGFHDRRRPQRPAARARASAGTSQGWPALGRRRR